MIKQRISAKAMAALAERGESLDEFMRKHLNIKDDDTGDWTCKGVTFPEGTFFRTWFRDRPYWGEVKGGALIINGERYTSPSAAAVSVFGRPTNGWDVWECRMPKSKRWVRIGELRSGAAH